MKFRCKVIRHLMSDSVSEMPIFEGFWVIFLWGRDLQDSHNKVQTQIIMAFLYYVQDSHKNAETQAPVKSSHASEHTPDAEAMLLNGYATVADRSRRLLYIYERSPTTQPE